MSPMEMTDQEKRQKQLLEIKKALEKEIENKKNTFNVLVQQNRALEAEQRLLEIWLEKYTDEELSKS